MPSERVKRGVFLLYILGEIRRYTIDNRHAFFLIITTRQFDSLSYINYDLIIDLTDIFNLNC